MTPSRIFLYFSGLYLITVFISLQSYPPLNQSPSSILGDQSIHPATIISMVNLVRVEHGLLPLKVDPVLEQAAQAKAANMLSQGYWAHQTISDDQPWLFLDTLQYSYLKAGENLARDYPDVQTLITAWLASPGHRQNLLDPAFTHSGVAVIQGTYPNGQPTQIIVQFFTQPSTLSSFQSPPLPTSLSIWPNLGLALIIFTLIFFLLPKLKGFRHSPPNLTPPADLWRHP